MYLTAELARFPFLLTLGSKGGRLSVVIIVRIKAGLTGEGATANVVFQKMSLWVLTRRTPPPCV
ncbi:hypothetical protein F183_A07420 [Bryobacterales bacterium F-183]|nr:hypothetical protein F183_A07420 [Bryobacterales bacterium F-183]